jgi:transcriptional regulator with XRE-family HTH domain
MDNIELGATIKNLRKTIGLTQREFSDKTETELKKVSRLECGYQLPDEDYFASLETLKVDQETIKKFRQWTDDARRETVIKRTSRSTDTSALTHDVKTIKEIVARNNLLLRELISLNKRDTNDDLVRRALSPLGEEQ